MKCDICGTALNRFELEAHEEKKEEISYPQPICDECQIDMHDATRGDGELEHFDSDSGL